VKCVLNISVLSGSLVISAWSETVNNDTSFIHRLQDVLNKHHLGLTETSN